MTSKAAVALEALPLHGGWEGKVMEAGDPVRRVPSPEWDGPAGWGRSQGGGVGWGEAAGQRAGPGKEAVPWSCAMTRKSDPQHRNRPVPADCPKTYRRQEHRHPERRPAGAPRRAAISARRGCGRALLLPHTCLNHTHISHQRLLPFVRGKRSVFSFSCFKNKICADVPSADDRHKSPRKLPSCDPDRRWAGWEQK